jgi:hypothetical protein
MSKGKNQILIFEDDGKLALKVSELLKRKIPKGFALELFRPKTKPNPKTLEWTYEDRLRKEIQDSGYGDVLLIVCDRDLSRFESYRGLSEAVVSNVAAELGIPICLYAQGVGDELLKRQRNWGDGRIVLDSQDIEEMASKVAVIAKGFSELRQLLKVQLKVGKVEKVKRLSLVIAAIMGKPEAADHIALYGLGDQKMAPQVLPDYKKYKDKKHRADLASRLPSLVGYWIYDSILKYPGLLVNKVAAASHLNIAQKTFADNLRIQNLFKSALYIGPFSDKDDPLWWRGNLDDIVQKSGCTDGRELVRKTLKIPVEPCHCSLNPKKRAGYYCVVTKTPVSRDNSAGNIACFPQGADLARIRKDVYEEVGPWLGVM